MRALLIAFLLFAAVQAKAADEVKFDLCGPKEKSAAPISNDSVIASACSQGSIHFDGIDKIGISKDVSTRVELDVYARLPVANAPDPIVSRIAFRVLFDDPNEARDFVSLVRSGRIGKLVGVGRYTPMDAVSYSLGPVRLNAKNVFFYRRK